jgi:hypothetical protein
MIADNFDPLWIALGIKRKDWSALAQSKVTQ